MLPAVYGGATLILCESFMKIRSRFWQLVARFGVTYVEVVPTILVTMLHTPYAGAEVQANRTLRFIGCGSAPLPVDVQVAFQKKYHVPVANLYGLSETGPSHFDNPFRDGWRPGSIGTALDVNECVILREDKTRAALRGDRRDRVARRQRLRRLLQEPRGRRGGAPRRVLPHRRPRLSG